MEKGFDREIDYLRTGFLTYYILRIIEGMPKVDMEPYYALIAQELENERRLGGGQSLLHSRLSYLEDNGFVNVEDGVSPNPRAKKKIRVFSLSEKGRRLLRQLEQEQKRISESLHAYS